MSEIPAQVLIARALHHLETAQLEQAAGNYDRAAVSVERAVLYLKQLSA